MEKEKDELTESVDKSIAIAKEVNEFQKTKCYENIKTNQQLQAIKKLVDELRRKVLIEAPFSLPSELTNLYQA